MDWIAILILPPLSLALISGSVAAIRHNKDSKTRAIALSVLVGGISLILEILLLAAFFLATGRGGEVIGGSSHP